MSCLMVGVVLALISAIYFLYWSRNLKPRAKILMGDVTGNRKVDYKTIIASWTTEGYDGMRDELEYTNMKSAQLEGADLSGAALGATDLSYANLKGANLAGANL